MENQKPALELTETTPVTTTLNAGDWAQIMHALDDLPRKTAQPIWQIINDSLIGEAKRLSELNNGQNEKDEPQKDERQKSSSSRKKVNKSPAGKVKAAQDASQS
jgi:hypothetical protein